VQAAQVQALELAQAAQVRARVVELAWEPAPVV
jgi:hypothetical protein